MKKAFKKGELIELQKNDSLYTFKITKAGKKKMVLRLKSIASFMSVFPDSSESDSVSSDSKDVEVEMCQPD